MGFKTKRNSLDNNERYKAIAKRFAGKEGTDYREIFYAIYTI